MYKDHGPDIQLPLTAGWRASESLGDTGSACGVTRFAQSVPRVRAHAQPHDAPNVDTSVPDASGRARRAPAPPNAQRSGPYPGRAPRQRPADRAVATHLDRRRAAAKAAVVGATPSVARLLPRNEAPVGRAAPGVHPEVPVGEGQTRRTDSEAAAERRATEAVGHAKWRGGARDADLEAARWRRRAPRVTHTPGCLQPAFGPQSVHTTVRRGAGSTARACGSGRKKAACEGAWAKEGELGGARGAGGRPSTRYDQICKKSGENDSPIASRAASSMFTTLPPSRSCEQDSNIAGDRVIRYGYNCACVQVIWVRGESAPASPQEKSGRMSTTGGWSLWHLERPETVRSWRVSRRVASPGWAAVEIASTT